MPLSSRTLFSRLYAPPVDGARQAIALSRNEAEKIPFLDTVAIISITAPEKSPAKLAAFSHVLRLSFADVDFLATAKLSKRTEARLKKAFTQEQAGQVKVFVENLPSGIRTILVHCEGGFSRSCAIVLALNELYGCVVDHGQLSEANPSVLKLMTGR